jgi:hypothetical protein
VQCTFCLRDRTEVAQLVHGTGGAICDDCVLRIVRALEPSMLEVRVDCAHQLSLLASHGDETVNSFGSERSCRVALVVAAFAEYFDHWLASDSVADQVHAASQFWHLLQTEFAWNKEGDVDVAAALTALTDHPCRTHGGG